MAEKTSITRGFKLWSVIWAGQLVSLVGSGLTNFALGVWAYESSGSVTQFALIVFFFNLPGTLIAPVAGTLVDRWDRKWVMVASDTATAVVTLSVAGLLWADSLQIWHIYVAAALGSIFKTFQWPAYVAASTLMVPKRHFGRIGGMMQFGRAAAEVVAPVLAGFLMVTIQIEGVLLVDVATFLFAVTALLMVRVPRPEASADGAAAAGLPFHKQVAYGFSYIGRRPGLLGLLLFFAAVNLMVGIEMVLLTPLVLTFADKAVLGTVLSVASAGMVVGSILMMITGGPKRRVHGILAWGLVLGASAFCVGVRPWAPLVAGSMFVLMLGVPVINGCSQAVWQAKVAPDVQGRVFAVRRMVAQFTVPIGSLLAGPVADRLFEPAMAPGGALAGVLGPFLGTGEGRGIGLMFMVIAVLPVLASVAGWLYAPLRNVEEELPDAVGDDPEEAVAPVVAPA